MKFFTIKMIFLILCILSVLISQHIFTNDHHTGNRKNIAEVAPVFTITNNTYHTVVIEPNLNTLNFFDLLRAFIGILIGNSIVIEPYWRTTLRIDPNKKYRLVLFHPVLPSTHVTFRVAPDKKSSKEIENIYMSTFFHN